MSAIRVQSDTIFKSAYAPIPDQAKLQQEKRSLMMTGDFFKRVIITKDAPVPHYSEDGVLIMSMYDFLLNENSLECSKNVSVLYILHIIIEYAQCNYMLYIQVLITRRSLVQILSPQPGFGVVEKATVTSVFFPIPKDKKR